MDLLLVLVARWIHIACATLAIGAPFFVRFALLPAAARVLDEESHQKLKAAINARWKHIVYIFITLFILTGLFTFFVPIYNPVDHTLLTARWKAFSPEDKKLYHMYFGIKMLAALGIFFLASALAGRTRTFAPIRKNAGVSLTVLLLLAAVLLVCSSYLRYLPHTPPVSTIQSHERYATTRPAGTRPQRNRNRGARPPFTRPASPTTPVSAGQGSPAI